MRKISEILRLKYELHLAERAIAASCGSSRSTVQDILKRCRAAQITWPLPAELDEAALHAHLYPPTARLTDVPLPDFTLMQAELAKKGCHAPAPVARIQGSPSRWTAIQRVLRTLRGVPPIA